MKYVQGFAMIGLVISIYAIYVEEMKFADPTYEAMCDLASYVSCSKVLTSTYGHILSHWGLVPKDSVLDCSNALLGSIFYCILIFMSPYLPVGLVLFLSAFSVCFSVYLAYVLKFILEDICLVCVSSYIMNLLIFFRVCVLYNRVCVLSRRNSKSKLS